MDDDKIRNLFADFNPELSSSSAFISQLKRNMEAVEMVKQHNIALKKRNKLAVAIAAVSGFVMGVIATLLFPLIGNWMSTFNLSLPHIQLISCTIDLSLVGWIATAGLTAITALNAYEIALAKLTPKESPIG